MKTKGRWIAGASMLIFFAMATFAFGQPGRFDEPGTRNETRKRERVRDRIELMKMWKLTEALDLDQETAAKVFPLLNAHNEEHRKLREKRYEIISALKQESEKDQADTRVLRSLLNNFKENERAMVELRNKKLDDLSKLLGEEQVAKLIVFVPQFEREMRELIWETRHRHHGPQSKGGTKSRTGPPEEPLRSLME